MLCGKTFYRVSSSFDESDCFIIDPIKTVGDSNKLGERKFIYRTTVAHSTKERMIGVININI